MSCRRFRNTLIDYADGRLDGAGSEKVANHIESCEKCARAFEMLTLSRSALNSVEAVPMPAQAGARVSRNLAAYARGDRKAPRLAESRFGFLTTPRVLAATGTGVAILLSIVLVVVAFTGPPASDKNGSNKFASGVSSTPSGKAPGPGDSKSLDRLASEALPSAAAAILPVVKTSQTDYDENTLKTTFDNMEIKKQIADTCTMGHAISMGGIFRRKMADMMVDVGCDGAMLEAMITYLTNSEPVLLPYYAENAMFTGEAVFIIGLAGPRRMGQTTNLNRTEVWVMSPEKFPASPDSSVVFFLETKAE